METLHRVVCTLLHFLNGKAPRNVGKKIWLDRAIPITNTLVVLHPVLPYTLQTAQCFLRKPMFSIFCVPNPIIRNPNPALSIVGMFTGSFTPHTVKDNCDSWVTKTYLLLGNCYLPLHLASLFHWLLRKSWPPLSNAFLSSNKRYWWYFQCCHGLL